MSTTCNHAHARRDPATWSAWRRLGTMDDGDGGQLELRNCPTCPTTLALRLDADGAVMYETSCAGATPEVR